jgi:phosphoserine phosphatase
MLEWANMPIVTNPDSKMREHAIKNYWPILSLFT